MTKKAITTILLTTFLIFLISAGCDCDGGTNGDNGNGDENTIKIGLIVPYSGECGAYGRSAANAAMLAQQEINDAGGVLGKNIELVIRDSHTDPFNSRYDATDLIKNDNVVAILGADNSDVTADIFRGIQDYDVIQITGSSTADMLISLDGLDKLFSMAGITYTEALKLATYLRNDEYEDYDSVALLLYVNDYYGNEFAEAFSFHFANRLGIVRKTVPFISGKASYAAEIESLFTDSTGARITDTTLVILAGYPLSCGQIMQDIRGGGFPAKVWFTMTLKAEEFITFAGSSNVEGCRGIAPGATPDWPPTADNEHYEKFREIYTEHWGEDPYNHRCTEHWYDAVILLGYAITAADTNDFTAIHENLRPVVSRPGSLVTVGEFATGKMLIESGDTINYDGASSQLGFSQIGVSGGNFFFWQILDGKIESYNPEAPDTVTKR